MEPLAVVLMAPSLDGGDVGEVFSAFQWVEALSRKARVTVLASSRDGVPLARQLPAAEVVTWPEPPILYRRFERFNAMVKPALPLFGRQVRRWLRQALREGRRFDIAHQILPQAMRYACPLRGLGLPYVIGPLGGGLPTPPGFRGEVRTGRVTGAMRALDGVRLRFDPFLRAGYAGADLVLGVAPYVGERLAAAGITPRRFVPVLERGHGPLPPERLRPAEPGRLKLVHVGRAVRTKGLRDTIRALALLPDLPGVTLTSAGDGEDLPACRAEAAALGVADRVTFLGKVPRARVEELYAESDVFCFPSFREPMGGVFFEAMAHGLPVITAGYGGPDFIVDDSAGIRIPPTDPESFAEGIAAAIRALAEDPARRLALGAGAMARLQSFGTWDDKAEAMLALYRQAIAAHGGG